LCLSFGDHLKDKKKKLKKKTHEKLLRVVWIYLGTFFSINVEIQKKKYSFWKSWSPNFLQVEDEGLTNGEGYRDWSRKHKRIWRKLKIDKIIWIKW